LSLDCDDGQVWCSLEVLQDGNIETDKLLYNLSQKKKLFDDHLWVSLKDHILVDFLEYKDYGV